MTHPYISHNEKDMIIKSTRMCDSGTIDDPVNLLRQMLLARGYSGFLGFGRKFREMDNYGSKILTFNEFVDALSVNGLELSQEQTEEIFNRFDVDGSGGINISNFLAILRPEMSNSRLSILHAAFHKMDKDDKGVITMDVLKHFYNVHCNPKFVAGVESEETILKQFIDHFEENHHKNGEITKEDFENYYAAVSASVEDDTFFDLVIRQVYKL